MTVVKEDHIEEKDDDGSYDPEKEATSDTESLEQLQTKVKTVKVKQMKEGNEREETPFPGWPDRPKAYSVKETTVPDEYKLKGKPNGINNFDEFSWWVPVQFGELDGLWDESMNSPTDKLTPVMLLRNMDIALHSEYRAYKSGPRLWSAIRNAYSASQSNSQALLLSAVAKYQPPIDMDVALEQMNKNVRLMVNAFGSIIDTELAVQILFAQNLPAEYDVARIAAISQTTFEFSTLENSLKAIWDDRKRKKSNKILIAATADGESVEIGKLKKELSDMKKALMSRDTGGNSVEKNGYCKVHTYWELRGEKCVKCNPCSKCTEKGAVRVGHDQNSRACPFYKGNEKGAAKIAKVLSGPVDSGASNHTFANKEVFEFYSPSFIGIETANGGIMDVPGIGSVSVETKAGQAIFTDSYHCPNLCEPALFSVSKFDAKGYASIFCDQKYLLIPKEVIEDSLPRLNAASVLDGRQRDDGLYWIDFEACTFQNEIPARALMASVAKRSAREWHLALNHPSSERLGQMAKGLVNGCVISDSISQQCECESCFMGKSKNRSYPRKSKRHLESVGDLVSVDGFGPLKQEDWNGNKYYMVFIDHFSGKSFMYLYSTPSRVAQLVVAFLTEVEIWIGRPIKVLRSDKEGGYVSKLVKAHCQRVGTKLEYTLTDAHQQNGMSEGFNLHCLDTVRTMMAQSQLGEELWGEACMNYNYTRNKLPTVGRSKSPDEIWYKQKPDVHHLRMFGEECFAHVIPKDRDSKLSPRATKAIFLGYDLQTKAYRLMDPSSNSMFLSRSVEFIPNFQWPSTKESRFGHELDEKSVVKEKVSTGATIFNSFDLLTEVGESVPDKVVVTGLTGIRESNIIGSSTGNVKTRSRNRVLLSRSPVSLVLEPPVQFSDIAGRPDEKEWYEAARKEIQGIVDMKVGVVISRPKNCKVIKNRFVFTRKASGLAKGRVVLKDFVKPGEESVYSPVAEDASFKVFTTIAGHEDLDMNQYDVVQAFLHALMDGDVYTEIPDSWDLGPDCDPNGDYVLLLKKALYGHRKAPYLWNATIDASLKELGFVPSPADPCFYVKRDGRVVILFLLHVDDFLIADNDSKEKGRIVQELEKIFGLKHLGEVERYTNYQVSRNREKREVYVHQQDYIAELLKLAGMEQCIASKSKGMLFVQGLRAATSEHEIVTDIDNVSYRQLTGALIHLSCHSRPDIAFEVTTLCKYNNKPTKQHWEALKGLLQYLKFTFDDKLTLGGTATLILHGYADSGFASDKDTGKSPGGFAFFLGSSMVSHKSKWFSSVYPSSTESELAALYLATSKAIWLRKLLVSCGYSQDNASVIREDNEAVIKYTKTRECAGRMQHIDVKFHWIREKIGTKCVSLAYVPTNANVADIFTKTLRGIKLENHRQKLGLLPYIACQG